MHWIGVGSRTFTAISYNDILTKHLNALGVSDQDLIEEYIKAAISKVESIIGLPLTYSEVEIYSSAGLSIPINCTATSTYEYDDGWTAKTIDWANVSKSKLLVCAHDGDVNKNYKVSATVTTFTDPLIDQACRLIVGQMYENRENKEVNSLINRAVDQARILLSPITIHLC